MLALSASAQHTTVEKNGVNGRIETDYNAAGKAIEMRTIGPDGKVQQKVDYEYPPGSYVAQQTDTSYWPNGQIRKVVRKSYDESANFIGEFIQTFDESGKQVGGHKLTHDPWRGAYRCAEWNVAAQDYRAVACPSGDEESGGGGAGEQKKFTYDEVMKHLEAARKNASAEKELSRLPAAPIGAATSSEVGLVLPGEVYAGERISGTLVEDPERYAELPEVVVTRIGLPVESGGKVSRISGWTVDAPGEAPQRADEAITMVVPRGGSEVKIVLREAGNRDHFVEQTVKFPKQHARPGAAQSSFRVAALCMKGEICAVRGAFSGDARKTFAAFEERPGEDRAAAIVAESIDAAFVSVPESIGPGSHPLFIAERAKVIALPAVVGNFFVRNNGRDMQAGQSLITFPTLEGPEDIPDSAWDKGDFPEESLRRARQLISGFSPTSGKCAEHDETEADKEREAEADKVEKEEAGNDRDADHAREKKEEESKASGRIVLVVKNRANGEMSLHGAADDKIYFCLGDEAFGRGPFKYDLRVDAQKDGKVEVRGHVIPFLAPVAGQEFSAAGR